MLSNKILSDILKQNPELNTFKEDYTNILFNGIIEGKYGTVIQKLAMLPHTGDGDLNELSNNQEFISNIKDKIKYDDKLKLINLIKNPDKEYKNGNAIDLYLKNYGGEKYKSVGKEINSAIINSKENIAFNNDDSLLRQSLFLDAAGKGSYKNIYDNSLSVLSQNGFDSKSTGSKEYIDNLLINNDTIGMDEEYVNKTGGSIIKTLNKDEYSVIQDQYDFNKGYLDTQTKGREQSQALERFNSIRGGANSILEDSSQLGNALQDIDETDLYQKELLQRQSTNNRNSIYQNVNEIKALHKNDNKLITYDEYKSALSKYSDNISKLEQYQDKQAQDSIDQSTGEQLDYVRSTRNKKDLNDYQINKVLNSDSADTIKAKTELNATFKY